MSITDEPEVEVTLTIKLKGSAVSIDGIGTLAADLDRVLASRYGEIYRGPSIRITTEPLTEPLT